MSQTQILLYNFKDEHRLHQIRRVFEPTQNLCPHGTATRVPGKSRISLRDSWVF